jgi:hypothetical protein
MVPVLDALDVQVSVMFAVVINVVLNFRGCIPPTEKFRLCFRVQLAQVF